MTALKQEAIHLVEQMPEEQMPHIIQYIYALKDEMLRENTVFEKESEITPTMKAFLELEKMLVPVSEDLDYKKELAEARDEKYRIKSFQRL